MAAFYLDTSALAKRYARESGTSWVRGLVAVRAGNHVYTVRLTGPEMISALFRKARTGEISLAAAQQASARFRRDWRGRYHLIEVHAALTSRAMNLAEAHGLRGYDAVHLAAALELHRRRQAAALPSLSFVSADTGQLRAAAAEGLLTDDPNTHL